MSTLSYALLGLLARQPLSGYDLAQYMKKRVGQMWSALPSQIYPELARLEAELQEARAICTQINGLN